MNSPKKFIKKIKDKWNDTKYDNNNVYGSSFSFNRSFSVIDLDDKCNMEDQINYKAGSLNNFKETDIAPINIMSSNIVENDNNSNTNSNKHKSRFSLYNLLKRNNSQNKKNTRYEIQEQPKQNLPTIEDSSSQHNEDSDLPDSFENKQKIFRKSSYEFLFNLYKYDFTDELPFKTDDE